MREGSGERWARFLRALTAAGDFSLREGLWDEALSTDEAVEGAERVEYVARAARSDSGALAAWLALADGGRLRERVGEAKFAALGRAAVGEVLTGAILALFDPGPPLRGEDVGPPPDPVAESLTLGHRKSAVRGPRTHIMERLLTDPDPRVICEALRNPRLREREVVSIASRRPAPAALFDRLAASPRWIARAAVRRAVVLNPYAPPRLASMLLVSLPAEELRLVAQMNGLHPAVRSGALEVLRWECPREG